MRNTSKSYRVKVIDKEITDWSMERHCTLGISLGAHYHEGGKFRATVGWVSQNFDSCAIVVCDTLQRFNLPSYYLGNENSARLAALALGDEWLSRNSAAIELFSIPCQITRWEEWRTHPDFQSTLNQLEYVWQQDAGLRAIIEVDVARFIRNNPLADESHAFNFEDRLMGGIRYILEELAGLALFSRQHGAFEVYAGPKIKALNYLKQIQPASTPKEILSLRFLKIDFQSIRGGPSS